MKKRLVSFFLSMVMLLSLLPTTAFSANQGSFRDVAPTAWYYDAVGYVSREGIMSGVGNKTFSPESTLTRAQLCQILYNIEKKPYAGSGLFSDVSASAWYGSAVNWAATQNIVNGVGNGLFNPDNPISREQMVTILYRYATYKNYNLSALVSLADYSDVNMLSIWAQDAMQWAVSEGIISGTTATTISPQGTATRAQAAAMLMRFHKRMEAKKAFYAKDIEDFKGAEVINFDRSNETNFAVLVEDAVAPASSATVNQLVSADEESGVYKLTNIDRKISSLTPGDVLYLTYGSGADDYLLLKVGSIHIDGNTATITEGKAELSDYFQYIDVDVDIDVSDDDFGSKNTAFSQKGNYLSHVVAFAQNQQISDAVYTTPKTIPDIIAKDITGCTSTDLKLEIKDDAFSFTADVKMTLKLKICFDASFLGVDIQEISLSVKQETEVEAKLSKTLGEIDRKHETASATIPIMGGIDAKITPYFQFKAKASVAGSISGTLTTESGIKYSSKGSQPIQSSDAELLSDIIEGDFMVSVGPGVSVGVTVLKVIDLSFDGEAGVEMSGSAEIIRISTSLDEKHLCTSCTDGTIDAYFELAFEVKVGISKKYSWTLVKCTLAKAKIEIAKFYISFLGGTAPIEFGWDKCPHKQYLVTVVATDQFGNRLANVSVELSDTETGAMPAPMGKTGADGTYKAYYDNGIYNVAGFGLNGYQKSEQTVSVNGKAANVILTLKKDDNTPYTVLTKTKFKIASVNDYSTATAPELYSPYSPYQNTVIVDRNRVMEYTESGVQEVSVNISNYTWIKGFTSAGYAQVDEKAFIDASGNVRYLCKSDEKIQGMSDDGYAIIKKGNGENVEYYLLDINSAAKTLLYGYNQSVYPVGINEGIIFVEEAWHDSANDTWWGTDSRYDDLQGNVILPSRHGSGYVFKNGYARVTKNGIFTDTQIIDENGHVILDDANQDYDIVGDVSGEKLIRAIYRNGPVKEVFLSLTGTLVISSERNAFVGRDFHNGYAVVRQSIPSDNSESWYHLGDAGLIDPKGNFVIPYGYYKDLSDVSDNGLVWAIDKSNNLCVLKIA